MASVSQLYLSIEMVDLGDAGRSSAVMCASLVVLVLNILAGRMVLWRCQMVYITSV